MALVGRPTTSAPQWHRAGPPDRCRSQGSIVSPADQRAVLIHLRFVSGATPTPPHTRTPLEASKQPDPTRSPPPMAPLGARVSP
jgi:hypothetical protein